MKPTIRMTLICLCLVLLVPPAYGDGIAIVKQALVDPIQKTLTLVGVNFGGPNPQVMLGSWPKTRFVPGCLDV